MTTAPDPTILAAAITRMEAEIALFPEAAFPVEHEQTRAVVAAVRAYQPMRDALKKAEMDRGQLRLAASTMAAFASDPTLSGCTTAFGVFMRRDAAVEHVKAVIRSTLNPAGPA